MSKILLFIIVCLFSWVMSSPSFAGACCSKGSSGERSPLLEHKKKKGLRGDSPRNRSYQDGESSRKSPSGSPRKAKKEKKKKSRSPSPETRKESPRGRSSSSRKGSRSPSPVERKNSPRRKSSGTGDEFLEVDLGNKGSKITGVLQEEEAYKVVTLNGHNFQFPQGAIVETGGDNIVVVVPKICRAVLYPDETQAIEDGDYNKVRKKGQRPRNVEELGKVLRAMSREMTDTEIGTMFLERFVPIFVNNVKEIIPHPAPAVFPVQILRYKNGSGKSIVEVKEEEQTGYMVLTFPNVEEEEK